MRLPAKLKVSSSEFKYKRTPDDVVGGGGFSQVFKGTFRDRTVAVKEIRLDGRDHEKIFQIEVELWSRLPKHEHVLELIGYCVETRCLLSEYHDGGSLDEYCRKADFEFQICMRLLYQAATGLCALHDHRVVHGDIKPANVLVAIDQDGQPKARIADFGFSQLRVFREVTQGFVSEYHGEQGLSLRYASPEHFGQQVKEPGDCWSFATMCWSILGGGKVPYDGLSMDDVGIDYILLSGPTRR